MKEFILLNKHSNTVEKTFGGKDLYYRLPTKEEWEYAASANNGTPYGFNSLHAKDNTPNFNVEASALEYRKADVTVPVNFNRSNAFGMYNMIGNLAEMISEKRVCKGGSWKDSITNCEITDSIKYEKPSSWLGFRCVCVLTK